MPIYSYSRINTYDNCPKQYQFRYIDRVKPPSELETIEAFMGKCIHDVLKDFYQSLLYERIPQKEELLQSYAEEWNKKWTNDIVILKIPLDPTHYMKTGEKALSRYYDRCYPFQGSQSLGLEKALVFPVGPYQFKGFIDRLSIDAEGTYEIHDYKTSGSMPTWPEAEKDLQIALYQLSVHHHYPDASKVKSIWHYLLFDQSWTVALNTSQLNDKEAMIAQKVFTIEQDVQFQPQPSPLCHWCAWQELCPARTHAKELEEYSEPEENKGFALVSAYARLTAEHKKAKAAMDMIKASKEALEKEIVEYAKAHGFTVLEGKNMAVQIKEKLSYKFPDSKDPARALLEKTLDELGLWRAASIIHSARLNKIIKDIQYEEKVRQELLGFSSMELKTSLKWISSGTQEDDEEDASDSS